MLIQDYKFLRQPPPGLEMELNRIVDFHRFNKNKFKNKNRKGAIQVALFHPLIMM